MGIDDSLNPRRSALKTLSTGLILAATDGPVFAQSDPRSAPAASTSPFLPNPPLEYPRPPFPEQQQSWPGLVSKMNPRPDHFYQCL
jgi:hypothetical protein